MVLEPEVVPERRARIVEARALERPKELARGGRIARRIQRPPVRFGFDANWLEHPGFQASMPVRCAFSGSSEISHLLLRPMAFIDRSGVATSYAMTPIA